MTDDDRFLLIGQLQRHEGIRLMPYTDTVGKITIGVGRNLSDNGITPEEADFLMTNDIAQTEDELGRAFPWFRELDSVRQAAMVNIGFNLGLTRLLTFKKALTAMAHHQYGLAGDEFFDSLWARQVGRRASELCAQIRTGQWAA